MTLSLTRAFLAVFFCALSYMGQAGTLTCGDLPCEKASTQLTPWPSSSLTGFPVRDGPKLELTIPSGFDHLSRFNNLITFFYPTKNTEISVSFITYDIPRNGKNGPLGGWDVLKRTEKEGIKAYYYRDKSESIPTYTAVLVNTTLERIDGKLTCLELVTRGLSEAQFLEILSTTNTVDKLIPEK